MPEPLLGHSDVVRRKVYRKTNTASSTEANFDVRHQPAWHNIVQLGGWGGETWWEPFTMETLRIPV